MPDETIAPDLAGDAGTAGAVTGRRVLRGYLLLVLVPPLLLLLAAFFILPTRWFAVHSGNDYLANMGYGDTLHHADCQIVVYGDSSGMMGVDPLVIQQVTGMSACNISEYVGLTVVNGMMVPDHYLAANPRPRYMVFTFAPEGYARPPRWADVDVVEGMIYRLRQKRDPGTALLIAEHPVEVLSWLERGSHFLLTQGRGKPLSGEQLHLREATRGRFPESAPVLTGCKVRFREAAPDAARVAALRARYGVQGTRVLVDVTPVPDCDLSYEFYKGKFEGLTDDKLEQYPVRDYLDNGRLHMTPVGSRRFSTMIGEQILAAEGRH